MINKYIKKPIVKYDADDATTHVKGRLLFILRDIFI